MFFYRWIIFRLDVECDFAFVAYLHIGIPTCGGDTLAMMTRIIIPSAVKTLDIRLNTKETHGYQGQYCELMSPLSAFTHVYSLFFKIIRKNVDLVSFLGVAQMMPR